MKFIILFVFSCLLFNNIKSQNKEINNEQLEALCKVWGYMKYYDPNISQGVTNWDSLLINCLPTFYNKVDENTFNLALNNYILPKEKYSSCNKNNRELNELRWIKESQLINSKNKKILWSKLSKKIASKHFVKVNEVSKNCLFPNEERFKNISFPNKEYQLLTLFRYWNAIKYFYPYKHLMDKNWDKALNTYLPLFYSCSNEAEFHKLTFRLTTELRDTHVQTGSNVLSREIGYYFVPFNLSYIDSSYIITSFISDSLKEKSSFQIGDIILRKDEISISVLDSNLRSFYRASNNPTTNKYISDWILNGTTESVNLTIQRNKDTLSYNTLRISRTKHQAITNKKRKEPPFKLIEESIGYINIGSLYNYQIDSIFEVINKTKALIIDLREYPNETYYKLCSKIIKEDSLIFVKINSPNIAKPGVFNNEFTLQINGNPDNYYKGVVVLLIDENTQSQGEFSAMALELAPNVVKIGSQTAGADGNVSIINLPFGISTSFSGLSIRYPNGEETQRIGIVPDIVVEKKIEDILKKKDTVLQYAISYIKNI